ncbi:MAG: PspC domain-containing protein [Phocaeicola sp.]
MRKTLTVNLGGTVYHIDEDAYQLLESYLTALRAHFGTQEGGEEIVNDMEFRISEIFSEHIARGVQVIDYVHVEQIIARLGKPEEMDGKSESQESEPQLNQSEGPIKRKLFRNPDDKVLGGVCSGLAAYLGWDVVVLRVALLILGFFVHGVIMCYIIAWIIIPLAKTPADKLGMSGKSVNLENIGKSVTDGFEKVNGYVRSEESRSFFYQVGEGLVKVAGFLIKLTLIILAICFAPVLLIFLVACFALLLGSIGLLAAAPAILVQINQFIPGFDLQMADLFPGSTVVLAVSGILLVAVPVIGLIQLAMGYFAKWQPMSLVTKIILIILWILALGTSVYILFNQPYLLSLVGVGF